MDGHSETTGTPSVGVLADDEHRDRVRAAVEAAGAEPVHDEGGRTADPSFVVAVGESALVTAARRDSPPPVLAVDAGRGVASTPLSGLSDAVETVLAGEAGRTTRTRFAVGRGDEAPVRAVFDATLVTSEPARISEFRLEAGAERVSQFRADGVVVATPAGTHGYAAAADGPLLAPGSDVAAVVPLAPFVTDRQQWVLPDDALSLTVARDEGAVSVYADSDHLGTVPPGTPVTVAADGTVELLTTPATESFF